jgi:hypothetical protein
MSMSQNEYFRIQCDLLINVEALAENENVPDEKDFADEIPAPFKMASEIAHLDSQALSGLNFNNEGALLLKHYLEAQNQKINILLTYVLSQQNEAKLQYHTSSLSAGECQFSAKQDDNFQLNQRVRLKIFIPEESAAIYCYARISNVEGENITLTYQRIRDEDRELLIRTTLHLQSHQLKKRSAERLSQ